jgi:hypothetical protein
MENTDIKSTGFSIKRYRQILKEEGAKGFIKKVGWPVAIAVFMFFFIKGLVWLAIFYGGVEWLRRIFS